MGGTTNFGIVAVMVLLNVVLDVVQEHREDPMTTETQRRQAGGMAPTGARARQTVAMTRSFGTHVVVDRLDLSVAEGEAFGLLGRNGAGKSTLTKMLATLLPSSAGSAQVQAFDLVRQARNVRTAIGHVLQSLSADGELTGHENLLVFACLDDIPRAERGARIAKALAFMDLQDAAASSRRHAGRVAHRRRPGRRHARHTPRPRHRRIGQGRRRLWRHCHCAAIQPAPVPRRARRGIWARLRPRLCAP
jgi:ABC-type glutathione transport system ATPase component